MEKVDPVQTGKDVYRNVARNAKKDPDSHFEPVLKPSRTLRIRGSSLFAYRRSGLASFSDRVKQKTLYTALSVSTGLAGMAALARCSGSSCTTCFGCAVPGIGILVIALVDALRRGGSLFRFLRMRRYKNNGMA